MNKNTIIGLIVMAALMFGWIWWGGKQEEKRKEQAREQFVQDSLANPQKYARPPVSEVTESEPLQTIDSLNGVAPVAAGDSLAMQPVSILEQARLGEEKMYVLENEVVKVYISSRGGKVANVELKDYKRYQKDASGEKLPLMLFDEGSAAFDLSFFMRQTYNYTQLHTAEYNFNSDQPQYIVATEAGETLSLRLPIEEGSYVEYLYTIHAGEYMVDFDVRFVGMEEWTSTLTDFTMDWRVTSLQNEKGFKNENNNTDIAFMYPGVKKLERLRQSEDSRSGEQNAKVEWLDFKQQYFSSAFISDAENSFANVSYGFDTYKEGSGKIKDFKASFTVPYNPVAVQYDFRFYFGPNHYSTMKQYDLGLEKVIPLGGSLLSWINTGFYIPVMNWLNKYISNYGIIILLLTLMVKVIILPLTYKSYKSSARMKALKPEIDEITARFPNQTQEDMAKKQQATMALYKQFGVSPLGGCLPQLIQFPIIIALFRFFPASIELRGESFLWAEDLSAYDSIFQLPFNIPFYGNHVSLFALLMAVSSYLYGRFNMNQTPGQQQGGMKFMMLYMMPIMMLCFLNNYSSGLSYYYTVSQLATMGIMWGFRAFTNEDKLRSQMDAKARNIASNPAKAAKAAKKSGFRQRYEEALRQQKEMQRQQQQKQMGGSAKSHTAKPRSTNMQPPKKRK